MTIYADTIFALNTLSNGLLFYSYCIAEGMRPPHKRLAFASAAGGIYAVLEVVWSLPRILRAAVLPGMVYAAFGMTGSIKHITKIMLVCFAVEGITLAAVSAIGAPAELAEGGVILFASEPIAALLYITAYPLYIAVKKLRSRRAKYLKINIKYRGRAVVIDALRDSGNLLQYHNKPVIMAAWEAVAPLLEHGSFSELKDKSETFVMYRTISGAGVLPIIEDAECETGGMALNSALAVVERKFKGKYCGIAGDLKYK